MAKNGLDKWFKQKWVDIGSKRKDGSYAKCGRSKQKKDAKRKYPKCVPLAKATRMSDSQRASAVRRKRAASNTGPKPTNVKTAVTGKVKPGSKAAKRRKSYCARSLGQLKRASAKTRNDPNSRIRQARRRWKC